MLAKGCEVDQNATGMEHLSCSALEDESASPVPGLKADEIAVDKEQSSPSCQQVENDWDNDFRINGKILEPREKSKGLNLQGEQHRGTMGMKAPTDVHKDSNSESDRIDTPDLAPRNESKGFYEESRLSSLSASSEQALSEVIQVRIVYAKTIPMTERRRWIIVPL